MGKRKKEKVVNTPLCKLQGTSINESRESKAVSVATSTTQNPSATPLNEIERLVIKNWEDNFRKIRPIVKVRTMLDSEGKTKLDMQPYVNRGSDEEKRQLMCAGFSQATGVRDHILAAQFAIGCCLGSGMGTGTDVEKVASDMNLVLCALNSLKPQDEFEGMLITRLVSLHFQIMEFMQRSIVKGQVDAAVDLNINRSTKLSRVYNETLETLMRYRRKGEQKVVVQHVNVTDGGQAIVSGQIIAGGRGV